LAGFRVSASSEGAGSLYAQYGKKIAIAPFPKKAITLRFRALVIETFGISFAQNIREFFIVC
jgi:hypothetical protein